jgi:hypothetical protein
MESVMDYRTTSEMLRLNRLEQRAKSYFKIGCTKSDLARLVRAARLETAANSRLVKLMTQEIEAYRPSPSMTMPETRPEAMPAAAAKQSHFAAEALI